MNDWKETTLWKQLETASGPEAVAARALLDQEMPGIQTILTQAHTAPTDFTLHDADHSFRVAKWMAEIIPGDVLEKLSPYEITLLLLSAYLHDIGMTPEQGRVERLWYHLVYGAPDPKSPRLPLTEEEARDLQGWLDDDGRDLTIPLAPDGAVSEETKRLADLMIAHYCRHKHNEWSGDWIRTNLDRKALAGCETWIDDLVQLCHSHHEGYDELKQSRFDPRPAGPSGQPVHHRYLACVLRVADVLEIDPERTPEVIFRHREIHPGSVLYWRKDHENWIIRDGNNLSLAAYPESAVLENAIRKTADGIRQELATCARLNREQPFFYWQLRPTQPLPHRWDFPEVLTERIQPRNDAYVYIDGAFRPNTEKLLELLSGTQLYGNPLVAVRELLQNAFDAVKEEMAYQRLERPGDREFAKHLAATHRVELRLEERDGRQWLVCKDTGAGMTRRIIENYLLVSGNSRRREIVELERRCRDAGFLLGRTGQFGIGILSYFMLADRVEIRTRRSTARADAEATGWSFSTEGVGSFGELKKDPAAVPGTEVRWRLREELKWKGKLSHPEGEDDEQRFSWETLKKYVSEVVRYLPCTLDLQKLSKDRAVVSWKAGWVQSAQEIITWFLGYKERGSEAENFLLAVKRLSRNWFKLVLEALRWRVEENELPHKLGTYRISVPWFELPTGRCEAFMLIRSEGQYRVIKSIGNAIGFLPKFKLNESIYGMSLDREDNYPSRVGFQEIDWANSDAGRLRVDRSYLETSPLASEIIKWVNVRASEILEEVLTEKPSEFALLSEGWPRLLGVEPRWVLGERREDFVWGSVPFPVTFASGLEDVEGALSYRGKNLATLLSVTFMSALHPSHNSVSVLPIASNRSPDRVVQGPRSLSFRVFGIWENFQESDRRSLLGKIPQFPPEWRRICGINIIVMAGVVWNADHPLVSQVDEDSVRWLKEVEDLGKDSSLEILNEEILASPGRMARALCWILEKWNLEEFWKAFTERNRFLAERLLQAAIDANNTGEEDRVVGFLRSDYKKWKLVVLTADSVVVAHPGDPLFEKFLPPPGPDWVITEASSDDGPT